MCVFVEAYDSNNASFVTDSLWKEIAGDVSANAYITEVEAIKTMEEFKEKAEDWKESFIPYTMKVRGAYKDKTIKDLLENAK